jgi:phosphoribosyl-ATP pyrophosphohydrolase
MTADKPQRLEVLAALAATIAARRRETADASYTARLLAQGVEKCAKKLGEEAVEAALAAVSGDRAHLRAEAADVLYHLLVVLEACGVGLDEVMAELEGRMELGGLAEKAGRKTL